MGIGDLTYRKTTNVLKHNPEHSLLFRENKNKNLERAALSQDKKNSREDNMSLKGCRKDERLLSSSTPHISKRENQQPQQGNVSGFIRQVTHRRKRRQNSAPSSATSGQWVISDLDTSNVRKRFKKQVQELQEKIRVSEEKSENEVAGVTIKFCVTSRHDLELQEKLDEEKGCLLYKTTSDTDFKVRNYTGLPNYQVFRWVLSLFTVPLNYHHGGNVEELELEDQLFMTLMKLRLNYDFEDLATMFDVSRSTVANVVYTWIDALHDVVYSAMGNVPCGCQLSIPACFDEFQNCKMIIACTEVGPHVPSSMKTGNLVSNDCKHLNTLKGLVGIAPNGTVVFVSTLYPSSISDKQIVQKSMIVHFFGPGDLLLADKGSNIQEVMSVATNYNPPILITPQFAKRQMNTTRKIARARIHVERAIQRIKDYYIVDCVDIDHNLVPQSSKIWQVCAALTNLQTPLIKEVEDAMIDSSVDDFHYEEYAGRVDFFQW